MKKRDRFVRRCRHEGGFTLVEIMITLVISGIIVGAIYSTFTSQQRTYLAQEQVAEMQQNIRSGLMLIKHELRMAGYDPTSRANAGITTAQAGQVSFTQDITDNAGTGDGDGDLADTGEIIDFGFKVADDGSRDGIPADSDGDGIPDAVSICRQTGGAGGYQQIAENIQAIEFRYLDSSGTNLGDALGTVPAASLADIRSIEISILARAGKIDRSFPNSMTYCPASNPHNAATGQCTNPAPAAVWGPYNDNFRRRLLITTVNCRNMGL